MSSQLTTLVPLLDGTNYQKWASCMKSFLMSQGQWKVVKDGSFPPEVTKTETEGVTVTTGQKELDEWNKLVEKAMGNIRLRLHDTISYQFNEEEDPSTLWDTLRTKYGQPGLTRAFVEFKGVMDTVIPNGQDPSPALDKIMAHFARLKEIVRATLNPRAPAYYDAPRRCAASPTDYCW